MPPSVELSIGEGIIVSACANEALKGEVHCPRVCLAGILAALFVGLRRRREKRDTGCHLFGRTAGSPSAPALL